MPAPRIPPHCIRSHIQGPLKSHRRIQSIRRAGAAKRNLLSTSRSTALASSRFFLKQRGKRSALLRLSFHAHHSPSTATLPAGRFLLGRKKQSRQKFFIRFPIGCSGRSSEKPPSPPPPVSRSGRRSGSRRRQILENRRPTPEWQNARCLGPPLFFWRAGGATSFSGDDECFPNVSDRVSSRSSSRKGQDTPAATVCHSEYNRSFHLEKIAAGSRELGKRSNLGAIFKNILQHVCSRRSRFQAGC